jgi:hypothetical protein
MTPSPGDLVQVTGTYAYIEQHFGRIYEVKNLAFIMTSRSGDQPRIWVKTDSGVLLLDGSDYEIVFTV